MDIPTFIFLSGQCLMKAQGNPASAHHVLCRSIFISAIISIALTTASWKQLSCWLPEFQPSLENTNRKQTATTNTIFGYGYFYKLELAKRLCKMIKKIYGEFNYSHKIYSTMITNSLIFCKKNQHPNFTIYYGFLYNALYLIHAICGVDIRSLLVRASWHLSNSTFSVGYKVHIPHPKFYSIMNRVVTLGATALIILSINKPH